MDWNIVKGNKLKINSNNKKTDLINIHKKILFVLKNEFKNVKKDFKINKYANWLVK